MMTNKLCLVVSFILMGCMVEAQNNDNIKQVDDRKIGICRWKDGRQSAVALTFDDWTPGQYPLVVPALQKYGLVATFFPILNNIERYDYSWSAIQKTIDLGNEIANHTVSHPDLTKLTVDELSHEITTPQTVIREHVGTQVNTLAYPYGAGAGDTENDRRVRDSLRASGHIGARSVWGISNYVYDFANCEDDYYKIQMYALTEQTTNEQVFSEFNKIVAGGGLLTVLYHSVDDEQNTYNDNWYARVKIDSLCKQLAYLKDLQDSKQVWVTTFRDAIVYHREANNAMLKVEKQTRKYLDLSLQIADGALPKCLSQDNLLPLTIVVYKNDKSEEYSSIAQNGILLSIKNQTDNYVVFDAVPNGGVIRLVK